MTTGKAAWTCPLDRAQVDACKCIAEAMHKHAIEISPPALGDDSTPLDFAKGKLSILGDQNPQVTLVKTDGVATDPCEVKATFSCFPFPKINVSIPRGGDFHTVGAKTRSSKCDTFNTVRLVVASAVVHELVHAVQFRNKNKRYETALSKSNWTNDPQKVASANPQTWLDGYYKVPAEFEAHAVQAAAEVYFSDPSITDEGAFPTEFGNTPLFARISARVGEGKGASDWWSCFQAAAWAAYRSWRTP